MKRIVLALAAACALSFPAFAQLPALTPGNAHWVSAAPGEWSVVSQPAATTAASASRAAAAAGVKHVAVSATVCISAVAAQPDIIFNLRDGATGAGTILWTVRLASPTIGSSLCVTSPRLNIIGSAATAMTLESAAAPAATNFATATLAGYDAT